VAPVLLDAAFDTSLRDLRDNWLPVSTLVFIAVGLTTATVAVLAHWLVPGMPWAAAIALGAIVAPPMRRLLPRSCARSSCPIALENLEGESLLNDASALLIYRVAVGAAAMEHFRWHAFAPAIVLALAGSLIAGFLFAKLSMTLTRRITDARARSSCSSPAPLRYGSSPSISASPHPHHRRLCRHHRAHSPGADAGALEGAVYAVWRPLCSCSTCWPL